MLVIGLYHGLCISLPDLWIQAHGLNLLKVPVLSDEVFLVFQYLGNWDSTRLLLSHLPAFNFVSRANFLLPRYAIFLRLLKAYAFSFPSLSFGCFFSPQSTRYPLGSPNYSGPPSLVCSFLSPAFPTTGASKHQFLRAWGSRGQLSGPCEWLCKVPLLFI